MTPKEKANDLLDKMYSVDFNDDRDDVSIDYFHAKKCALIAVDEIMKQCWEYRDIDLQKSFDYWQEVKQEIEQL
jgi:hypothetical protein